MQKRIYDFKQQSDIFFNFSSLPADPTTPILHYHHITPVDIRNYHVLRTDVPEVKYEKTKYIKYMRREMTYWQVR